MTKKGIYALIFLLFFMLLPTTVYANSSWHWLTETNPFDVLPFAVILTLLVEFIAIQRINNITRHFRLFIIICLANLASFLLPYAVLLLPSAVGYTFEMSINNTPKYIVGLGYLFLTLISELPIVYFSHAKLVSNKKTLLISIVVVNVLTTMLVAGIERIICKGMW